MRIFRTLIVVPLLALAACASATGFEKPIGDFADATAKASAALQALDQASAQQYNAISLAEAVAAPGRITRKDGECRLRTSKSCTLVLLPATDGAPTLPLHVTSLVPHSIEAMNAVNDYAAALKSLVTADASADVKDGLGKALAAAVSLGGTLGVTNAAALSAIQTPLTDVGVYLFQQYQNDVKIDALRRATQAADPTIQAAMDLLSMEYAAIQSSNASRASDDYEDKLVEAREKTGNAAEPAILALIDSAQAFDAALKLRNTDVYAQVAKAHNKLTQALKNPEVSLLDAIAQVQLLVEQIKNLQTVAEQIAASNKKPAK